MSFLDRDHDAGHRAEPVRTFGGRLVRTDYRADTVPVGTNPTFDSARGRIARNSVIQGSAAELFKGCASPGRRSNQEKDRAIAGPRSGVLAAALAMIVLDGTIVGVALPRIIDDLRVHLTEAQWVNSLYAMVFAALLLASGRLGDRVGRGLLLVIGVLVFVGAASRPARRTDRPR